MTRRGKGGAEEERRGKKERSRAAPETAEAVSLAFEKRMRGAKGFTSGKVFCRIENDPMIFGKKHK